jgi:aerobic carbon-monoxide dehydrogenase medium subunit
MYDFSYTRPDKLQDAATLAREGGQPLAGGQTLLASMKLRLTAPGHLIDLASVPDLAGIRVDGQSVRIGAMTRHADVAAHPVLRERFPALADLAGRIGDRQVRARGTIGGSVANNDPAACYPSALLACGATIETNLREIAADDFFLGLFTTALEPGELITAVRFPIPQMAAYEKLRQAASHFPLIGVFVARCTLGVRVAITGGGYGVYRDAALEHALSQSLHPDAVEGALIDTEQLAADLHASRAYRAQLIRLLCGRAVERAIACR